MYLRNDGKALLKTKAGIALLTKATDAIRGSVWEDIVFPKPLAESDKALVNDFHKAFENLCKSQGINRFAGHGA